MKNFVLTGLFLLICAVTTQGQKCDCTITPYQPTPPCFEFCTQNLLATTSLEDLIYILGLKEETAWKIVNWPKRSGNRSLADYREVLGPEEFDEVMRRANSLNQHQIYYIYRKQSPSKDSSTSPEKVTSAGALTRPANKINETSVADLIERTARDARVARASAASPAGVAGSTSANSKKKQEDAATYYYFQDKNGRWRWRLKAADGRTIAESATDYLTEGACLADIERAKQSAGAPVKTE